MKLKKTDNSKEAKALRLNKLKVKKLSIDVDALIDEHDFYTFATEQEAAEWFQSFPIETLGESLSMDRNAPREKPSLQDMYLKSKLRKDYYKKSESLEKAIYELNIANIDFILSKVDGYVNNSKTD